MTTRQDVLRAHTSMFTPADIDLIERDRALPGLRAVLDPETLVRALRPLWPGLGGGTADYVRYKPGTNALAAHRLDVDGAPVLVYAKAYRAQDREKLDKARRLFAEGGAERRGFVLDDPAVVVSVFPHDARLRVLARLEDDQARERLFRRVFPEHPELWQGTTHLLRYKPERRYVGRVDVDGEPRAVLKVNRVGSYRAFRDTPKAFKTRASVRLPRRIGHSDRHGILGFEWMPGRPLDDAWLRGGDLAEDGRRIGEALAGLHAQPGRRLERLDREVEAGRIDAAAGALLATLPGHAVHIRDLAGGLADALLDRPAVYRPIHGDFYARQVLLADEAVTVLDFDESMGGDQAQDLGNFLAHLEHDRIRLGLPGECVEALRAALVGGYTRRAREADIDAPEADDLDLYTAAGLFRLAPHPFRNREPDWPGRTRALLDRIDDLLYAPPPEAAGPFPTTIVEDPFAVVDDPEMPFLPAALDPMEAARSLGTFVPRLAGQAAPFRVGEIRVLRHKPGRRCLVGYDLEIKPFGQGTFRAGLIGKVRAKGLDEAAYRLNEALWNGAFGPDATDGIRVPEPVGCVPAWRMWLQRRVHGVQASEALAGPGGVELARRTAAVLRKLRRHGPPPERAHKMADELRILRERLPRVAGLHPAWSGRIERVLAACDRLGAALPLPDPAPVHRDFYPDNLLVDGDRLTLLDLDLYALGDPAVDAGNFIAHLTEQSLRTTGDPAALADRERAFEEAFGADVDARTRLAVRVYTTLTLVRHIELSTRFQDRRPFTGRLLALCEQRLRAHVEAAPVRSPVHS